jgi:hypothetical protein
MSPDIAILGGLVVAMVAFLTHLHIKDRRFDRLHRKRAECFLRALQAQRDGDYSLAEYYRGRWEIARAEIMEEIR